MSNTITFKGMHLESAPDPHDNCVGCIKRSLSGINCFDLPECSGIIWVEVVPDTPLQHYHAALEQDIG